jgi:molecular chaperone GrpE
MNRKTNELTELEKKLAARSAQAAASAPEPAKDEASPPETELETGGEEPVLMAEPAPSTAELEQALAAAAAERDEYKDLLQRARADFDNYRKRMAREMDDLRRRAAEDLIRDLLPVGDNLERALAHAEDRGTGLAQGVEMVLRQFQDVLAGRGVAPIPAAGAPFDPNLHDALSQQPSEEYADGVVMQEWERGYRLGDSVLRHAKVVVSSGPPAPAAEPAPEDSKDADDKEEEQGGNA